MSSVIDEEFNVSFITYIEFLGYKDAPKATENFIGLANVLHINNTIIDICIGLRKQIRIKLPDAIIAATALAYNYMLVTNNEKDFENIKGLLMINPMAF